MNTLCCSLAPSMVCRAARAAAAVALVLLPSFGAAQSTKYKKGDAVPLFANKVRPRGVASLATALVPRGCAAAGVEEGGRGGRGSGERRRGSGQRLAGWLLQPRRPLAIALAPAPAQPARGEAQAGAGTPVSARARNAPPAFREAAAAVVVVVVAPTVLLHRRIRMLRRNCRSAMSVGPACQRRARVAPVVAVVA